MRRRFLLLLVLAMAAAARVALAAQAQDTYAGDPAHTYAFFEVGHLGISWIRGRFNKVDARVTLDRANLRGAIEAVIDTASLDTGHAARDKHLRSEDYLHVEKFPTMTFRSSNLRFKGDTLVGADGELTLLGVTRPVALDIGYFKCIQHPRTKQDMCGADARTTIRRSEFGLKRGADIPMHDEVRIALQIEAVRQ